MATTPFKKFLQNQGLRQTEVAREAKIGSSTVNKIANGHLVPSRTTAARIAQAIGRLISSDVSVPTLFEDVK